MFLMSTFLFPFNSCLLYTSEQKAGSAEKELKSLEDRREQLQPIMDSVSKEIKEYGLSLIHISEMFGYSTDLRSKTQGRGNYSMFFEKYEPVPKSVQEKVLSNKNA